MLGRHAGLGAQPNLGPQLPRVLVAGNINHRRRQWVLAAAAQPTTEPPATSNGAAPPAEPASADKSRVRAVAAKITAARELARRLAEEQQAAAAAAKSQDKQLERFKRSTEEAAAVAAAQAARADALARALKRAETGREQLTRLKNENEALKELLLELAADRQSAQARLQELQAQMSTMVTGGSLEELPKIQADAIEEPAQPSRQPGAEPAPLPSPSSPWPSNNQLREAAQQAASSGHRLFTWPPERVPVGSRATVFYNRAAGPLAAHANTALQLKAGPNKWEEIQLHPMKRSEELANTQGADWWAVELDLPKDLFQFDFVVLEATSGAVDNNGAKDFQLPLSGGPTEQQVLDTRAAAYAAADKARRKLLAEEEDRIWVTVQQDAARAADRAREDFRERRSKELMAAATQAVNARLAPPEVGAAGMADAKDGLFMWRPCARPRAGHKAQLLYNCRGGPLAAYREAKLHYGFDGWKNQKQVVDMNALSPSELQQLGLPSSDGGWCNTWVQVPADARVLDFVVSDRDQRTWDNNGNKDFHTRVDPESTEDPDTMIRKVYDRMLAESASADAAAEERAAVAARKRVEAKAMVLRQRRAAQQEFLYTLPITPRAGEEVELFYNPDLTPLRGRPDIYVRGAFNRWQHPQRIQPVRMTPAMPGNFGFLKAKIQIPSDAHVMDVLFSDTSSDKGGFFDNNGGLDYHIPVVGGTGVVPGLKVVHVAVEMAPIAKVGGMGDVVTALGRAVQDEGHSVEVVIPKYDIMNYSLVEDLHQDGSFHFGNTMVRVWRGRVEGLNTTFLEPENGFFWVGCIYGRNDDHVRFGFFCGAALEYLKVKNVGANIIHCHDWQSAACAWGDKGSAKSVFTIHNLNYGADLVGRAMAAADVATTVSPTYAREISGHQAIAAHLNKMFGIRNGIDQEIWDPATDPFLPAPFGPEDVTQGKAAARAELRRRMNLADIDVPVVGCVTRLVHQKGIHLIKHAAWRTLERGGQFVLLGSAPDPRVQGEFNALKDQLLRQYPDRAALCFSYDEPLSHLIYAGSDMFLVPSMFEPCGLTQMIAMRYGTVPVVRKTGGLADTVFDVDHDEERAAAAGYAANGFSFEGTDTNGMDYALNRALSMWHNDRAYWQELASRVMTQDWSWDSPAMDYISLYWRCLKP